MQAFMRENPSMYLHFMQKIEAVRMQLDMQVATLREVSSIYFLSVVVVLDT
jgi:hypothetical protein